MFNDGTRVGTGGGCYGTAGNHLGLRSMVAEVEAEVIC